MTSIRSFARLNEPKAFSKRSRCMHIVRTFGSPSTCALANGKSPYRCPNMASEAYAKSDSAVPGLGKVVPVPSAHCCLRLHTWRGSHPSLLLICCGDDRKRRLPPERVLARGQALCAAYIWDVRDRLRSTTQMQRSSLEVIDLPTHTFGRYTFRWMWKLKAKDLDIVGRPERLLPIRDRPGRTSLRKT